MKEQAEKKHFKVSVTDMLLDFKVLLKEYYCATLTDEVNALKISLNNGQTFVLEIKSI